MGLNGRLIKDESDFWAQVRRGPLCWPWFGPRRNGVPIGRIEGTQEHAARIAYALTNGPPPEGSQVRRACRNLACVRPDHLRVVPTWQEIAAAHQPGDTQQQTADRLGVERETVSRALSRARRADG